MKKEIIKKEVKNFLVMFMVVFAFPLTLAWMMFTAKTFAVTVISSILAFFIFYMVIIRSVLIHTPHTGRNIIGCHPAIPAFSF
jgi:hypothetical protein